MKPRALTKWRKANDLSMRELAKRLQGKGISIDQGQISRWEAGLRFPKPHLIAAVARATGLKVDDLSKRD